MKKAKLESRAYLIGSRYLELVQKIANNAANTSTEDMRLEGIEVEAERAARDLSLTELSGFYAYRVALSSSPYERMQSLYVATGCMEAIMLSHLIELLVKDALALTRGYRCAD